VGGARKFRPNGSARQTIGGMHDRPPHCERFDGKPEVVAQIRSAEITSGFAVIRPQSSVSAKGNLQFPEADFRGTWIQSRVGH